MRLGDAVVQGGLLSRDVDVYEGQRAEQGYRMKQIQKGIRDIEDHETARPMRQSIAKLKQEIEHAELEFSRTVMPREKAMKTSDLQHRESMQPGAQTIDAEAQAGKLAELREKQIARMWPLYSSGDKQSFLEVLNKSKLIAPGRSFADVVEESKDVSGTQVPVLQFVPADGGQPVTVTRAEMEGVYRKHNTKYMNVGGGTVVEVGPEGAKPAFSGAQQASDLRVREKEREYELRRQLEEFKSRGAGAVTSLQKNIQFLIDQGVAANPTEAFERLRTAMEKPEDDAILSLASNLMRGPGYGGPKGEQKAIETATRMVKSIRGSGNAGGAGSGAPAGGGYKSAEEVRAAYRAKKIDRATALQELTRFGFAPE